MVAHEVKWNKDPAARRLRLAGKDLNDCADIIDQLVDALTDARGIVKNWCHYQGDTKELFDQYLGPIDAALDRACGDRK